MKKWLIVAFGLIAVVLLAGCRNKEVENQNEWKSLNNLDNNISFTLDELDSLEQRLFPTSYVYTIYQKEDWTVLASGNYAYLPDDKYLLPIEENLTGRVLSSSEIKDNMVYSMVDAKLDDDSVVSVLYINDPETLKYYFATVYGEDETILYTFKY